MGGERVDHAEAVTKFRREKLHLADVAKALGRTKEEHEADRKAVAARVRRVLWGASETANDSRWGVTNVHYSL